MLRKENGVEIKSLEIITNPAEFIKTEEDPIGSGSFSKVYKGKWKDQIVAIKVAFVEGRKSIFKEFQIYEKVSHPYILPAFGAHFGLENTLILALRKHNLTDYFYDYGSNLNFIQLKQYCIQVADALRYLHEKGILHCDLKIDNILVKDERGEFVEISDFGCAIDLKFDHNPVGTRTHLSYEVLKSKFELNSPRIIPSTASDVWSFAVTVWQIFKKTDLLPSDFQIPENIIKNYENGKMLPQPPNIPTELWRHIVFPCFNIHPKSRPSMNDLYNSFIKYQALPTETTSSTFIN
uniref:Protein kinase domain-containing protein n=1 Tax=Panagrolaimus davidi TaxID=227884 RepID=A0A914QAC3_9BILA